MFAFRPSVRVLAAALPFVFVSASSSWYFRPLLYVSDVKNNQVVRYDDRGFVDVFIAPGSGGLEHPIDILRGPDGNGDGRRDLLVVSRGEMMSQGAVLRYDGRTGAFIDQFAAAPELNWPHDMKFGPDGNLYVIGVRSDNVVRFDGKTGAFIDEFVTGGLGGIDAPHGLSFGPDVNRDRYPDLYVGSRDTDEVMVYSGRDGTFIQVWITAGLGGLRKPHDLLFRLNGDLLVTSHETDEVLLYRRRTGSFVGAFVTAGSGGLRRPHSMVYGIGQLGGPFFSLYVTSVMSDEVLRYDAINGRFASVGASGGGLERPHGLNFLPR